MDLYTTSYSSSKYNYVKSDGTLIYVYKSGSGIEYQYSEGLTAAKKIINNYSGVKNYVDLYMFFPLPGNTIKDFDCDSISMNNSTINSYANGYNDAIQNLKNNGYNVTGYVVSSHPVKPPQADQSSKVVTNQNKNACTVGYRSNWKYYQFNKAMIRIIQSKYSNNLKYESVFKKVVNVNEEGKNFSFNITYNTTDGVHWDADTTKRYIKLMFDYSNDL